MTSPFPRSVARRSDTAVWPRPHGLEDVRRLMLRREDLDVSEARRILSMLETDVADSTLLPVLDQLIAENRLSTNDPPAKRRRRG